VPATTVADTIARFFAGPYDAGTRTYRTPQMTVPGVAMGVLRRARPKRVDQADFYLGATGATVGFMIYILLSPGDEPRVGLGGARYGLKNIRHEVTMDCLLRSDSPYAEDTQDALYALQTAITDRIHTDRTCGSGGIEAGGFQIGEGGPPWIHWVTSDVVSTAEKTEALLRCSFAASEYIIA
jgi:hypothetical protein